MRRPGLMIPCVAALALPALADDLETVVVTARKASEQRDSLPLAVDVIDAARLRDSSAWNLQGIAAQLPGLGFESQFGAGGGVPTLRGLSQPSLAADNVGIFVDGVYQASRAGIDVDLLDLERVELLRGPQSALYGHSTFAGALHYVSQAPTTTLEQGARAEWGTGDLVGVRAHWSGPLRDQGWLGRIAVGHRRSGGVARVAAGDTDIEASRRSSVSIALASPSRYGWTAALRARLSIAEAGHPAVAALQAGQYNCGSRDPATGLWSYYCGEAPRVRAFSLSETPRSRSDVRQFQLHLGMPLGNGDLESDSSWYSGTARVFRDLDASAAGQLMGVCTQGSNCPLPGQAPVSPTRIVDVEQVLAQRPHAHEWTQELRWRTRGDRWNLLIGAAAFGSLDRAHQAIGVGRGDLVSGEQLTALVPGRSLLAGAVSQFNRALVSDPRLSQVDQSLAITRRRSLAAFAAFDIEWSSRWQARMEARQNRERIQLDSRLANFIASFGSAPARHFDDFTPRVSLMYRDPGNWSSHVSLARGARSGGINAVPNLAADEQAFAPETNWTLEWNARYAGSSVVRRLEGTLFYVDWRDTQTLGYAATPGVTNLITSNLAGIIARGLELQVTLQPVPIVSIDAAYSFVDSQYRSGTDDPGSIAFCGLSTSSTNSTFCTVGAPRNSTVNARRLVPWIDGNQASRTPRHSAFVAANLTMPLSVAGGSTTLGLQASHQGNMYERGIEGLRFGKRTLLNVRLAWQRRAWTLAFWGTNLFDRTYIRSSFSRQPQFFPTQPRPLDMIYGEGRRLGLSLEWRSRQP